MPSAPLYQVASQGQQQYQLPQQPQPSAAAGYPSHGQLPPEHFNSHQQPQGPWNQQAQRGSQSFAGPTFGRVSPGMPPNPDLHSFAPFYEDLDPTEPLTDDDQLSRTKSHKEGKARSAAAEDSRDLWTLALSVLIPRWRPVLGMVANQEYNNKLDTCYQRDSGRYRRNIPAQVQALCTSFLTPEAHELFLDRRQELAFMCPAAAEYLAEMGTANGVSDLGSRRAFSSSGLPLEQGTSH